MVRKITFLMPYKYLISPTLNTFQGLLNIPSDPIRSKSFFLSNLLKLN